MKNKTLLHCAAALFVLAFVLTPLRLAAQSNLVTWGVNGLSGSSAPAQAPTTNTVATGITASAITRGSGIGSAAAADSFTATNWNQTSFSDAIANGEFYTFTISAQANYSYSISNFTAFLRRSTSGATNVALATSLDSFPTAIGTTNVNEPSAQSRAFTNTSLTNITTTVEFRLAGWNAGGPSTFTITAIPEPSTYLAAAGLLGLMLWPSRKRILRDTKKILGITPPMRDKLAARGKV